MLSLTYYRKRNFGIPGWASLFTIFFIVILVVSCSKDSTSETGFEMPSTGYSVDPPLSTNFSSSSVVVSPDGVYIATANPDSDSITIIYAQSLKVKAEIDVGDDPRTVTFMPDSQKLLVSNHGLDTISVVDINKAVQIAEYPVGSLPYGIVNNGTYAFVAEFGLGRISVVDLSKGVVVDHISVDLFPSALALDSGGKRLFVTHFSSGSISVIDLITFTVVQRISTGADTNLSQFIAVNSDGSKAYIPQTRSNVTNEALLFNTTVFPVVNVVDLSQFTLLNSERITLDTADEPVNMPFAVAISPDNKTMYLANAGSNDVSIIDLDTNKGIAHIEVGANPRGIAITADGTSIFVNNVLDGTLSVIDTSTLRVSEQIILTNIPLDSQLLQGKRIFNSSESPVLSTDNWISCATCHFDGMMDSRTWLGFPDGPRNTPSLLGVKDTLPIHWSGDFDELHDVEITIREIQFGNGLVIREINDSLGSPHAGLSEQLDALAIYLKSIEMRASPFQSSRETIIRGRSLFAQYECNSCHMKPFYTDMKLHDVSTGNPSNEKNSHGRGTKFDTPSLRGVWMTAPYFHDGTAQTLEDVLQTGSVHNVAFKMDDEEIDALITFLKSLPDEN